MIDINKYMKTRQKAPENAPQSDIAPKPAQIPPQQPEKLEEKPQPPKRPGLLERFKNTEDYLAQSILWMGVSLIMMVVGGLIGYLIGTQSKSLPFCVGLA